MKAIQIVMKLHESAEYDLKEILEDVDDLSWDCLGLIQQTGKNKAELVTRVLHKSSEIKIPKSNFHFTILQKLQRQRG